MVINGKSMDRKKSDRLEAIAKDVKPALPVQERQAVFKSDEPAQIEEGFLVFRGNPIPLDYIDDVVFDAKYDNGVSPRYMMHLTPQAFRRSGRPAVPVFTDAGIFAAVGIEDKAVFVYNPEKNTVERYEIELVKLHASSKKKR